MRRIISACGTAVFFAMIVWACGSGTSPSMSSAASSPTTPTPPPTRIIGLGGNLAYGNVQVADTATANLTITNSGNSPLTITGFSVNNGLSSVLAANWMSGTIAASGSQQVTIRFTATAAQVYSGTLTVDGDQTSGANTMAVSGTGVAQPTTSPAPSPSCTYSLSIGTTISGYPTGGSFPITVNTGSGCAWTAVSNVLWIHIPAPASGSGIGSFVFTVDANTTGSDRTGTLTIAGQTVTFNQTASSPTPAPTPTPTPTPGPIAAPGLPPRTQVGDKYSCSLSDIAHPAACINNSFGDATAICSDGARSCSQNVQGTCSSHLPVYCYVCPGSLCP